MMKVYYGGKERDRREEEELMVVAELKYIEESWREKAHEEIELLQREVQILSETNSSLQQQVNTFNICIIIIIIVLTYSFSYLKRSKKEHQLRTQVTL